ncbi:hypothetical protein DSC45_30260 [Streptomyces sp. YIM 130001]|uniref:YraN family protein n=1 Tax=Streptomyces sp. YIM 130001 TaxID=2259644 RepID=UPI000E65B250|nr:YraN family protein [Streptomyces sp. YIM 130001]RII09584.1 hypothetical protein DSC45_30260 [Streptomyces sp. YIM 130001]
MNARTAIGRYGEKLAARRLTEAGMTILAQNWRPGRSGEIDIVALDGDALVVCEVKTRSAARAAAAGGRGGGTFEHPMAAVTQAKAERLRKLAGHWVRQHGGPPDGGVRIDLVGVLLPARGAPVVEHARGVA